MNVLRFLSVIVMADAALAQTNLPVPELPLMTNAGPAIVATNLPAAAPRITEIFSDAADFDLKHRIGVYRGNVRVIDAKMKLTCNLLTAQVSTNGGRPESITASGNVKLEGTDDQGRPVHVNCDKVVNLYKVTSTTTNDTFTLTGNVNMDSALFHGTGDPIVWDRITDSIHGENMRMWGDPDIKKSGTNASPVKFF